ncbi:unnamed protein product [Linum trigynum]|uniref:Uncharacterized protein n=1 Tax=Linum trigynum TaxID=586398 RepID=A0AAV2C9M3_9ROSI
MLSQVEQNSPFLPPQIKDYPPGDGLRGGGANGSRPRWSFGFEAATMKSPELESGKGDGESKQQSEHFRPLERVEGGGKGLDLRRAGLEDGTVGDVARSGRVS